MSALQNSAPPENLRRVETIIVALGDRSYPIYIGLGLLDDAALYGTAARQILVVTNETVAPLYLARVEAAFRGRLLETLILPDGERHKTLATFGMVLDQLVDANFHRDACLVALGGGSVFSVLVSASTEMG